MGNDPLLILTSMAGRQRRFAIVRSPSGIRHGAMHTMGFTRSLLWSALLLAGCTSLFGGPSPAPEQYPLTVASYNIHHGMGEDGKLDVERIANVLRNADVEVAALQEVDRHWSARSHFADQARALARMLGMYVTYGANLDQEPAAPGRPRRQYGTAILSRYPILESHNTALPAMGGEQRGLLEAVIKFHDRRVRVYSTHLQHDHQAERQLQARAILDLIGTPETPVVLMGDFNAPPDAREMQGLFDAFADAWTAAGKGDGFTYPAAAPSRRIDYVLVSDSVEVQKANVLPTGASDHLPVVAHLMVRLPHAPPRGGVH